MRSKADEAIREALERRIRGMTRDEAEVELREELRGSDMFVTFDSRIAFKRKAKTPWQRRKMDRGRSGSGFSMPGPDAKD